MFKRLFWIAVGVGIGVTAVAKANAYVRANTPKAASDFVLGPDNPDLTRDTLRGLVDDFRRHRSQRERELTSRYIKEPVD